MCKNISHTSESLVSVKRERERERLDRTERLWRWWFEWLLQGVVGGWITRGKIYIPRAYCLCFHNLENRYLELPNYAYEAFRTNKFIFWLEKNKFIKQGGMFYL